MVFQMLMMKKGKREQALEGEVGSLYASASGGAHVKGGNHWHQNAQRQGNRFPCSRGQ